MSLATPSAGDRYVRAARLLKDWLRQGVLREEDHPALYVYEQTFEVDGEKHVAQGLPGTGSSRADRQREDLPARADAGRPKGRPAGSVQSNRIQSEPRLRTLSRLRVLTCSARSRRACATVLPLLQRTTLASKTVFGS